MAQLTKLNPSEEKEFQQWIKKTGWYKEFVNEYGEAPNLDIEEYDYRQAWKSGVVPERDPYDNNRYHWPSTDPSGKMIKSASHPTAWKEQYMQMTGKNPDAVGVTKEQFEALLVNKRSSQRPMLQGIKR